MTLDDRLYDFFVTDSRARWRGVLYSLGVAGLAAATGIFVLGITADSELALLSSAASTTCFLFYLLRYVRHAEMVVEPANLQDRRAVWKLASATAGVAVLSALQFVLNRQPIDSLSIRITPPPVPPEATRAPRSDESGSERKSNVENAATPPDEALKIYADASKALNEIAQGQQIDTVPQFQRNASRAAVLYTSSDKDLAATAYVTANAVAIAAAVQEMHRRGGGSWLIRSKFLGGSVGARIGVDAFLYEDEFADLKVGIDIPIIGSVVRIQHGPLVVVAESTLRNCTQVLDGIIWINTTFTSCTLSYRGGVISLARIRFVNCVFDDTFSTLRANPKIERFMVSTELVSYSSRLG